MSVKHNQVVKDAAVNLLQRDPSTTEEEVALLYGLSRSTLSRALAEKGYKKLRRWKTNRENSLLDYLELKGITDLNTLKQHI